MDTKVNAPDVKVSRAGNDLVLTSDQPLTREAMEDWVRRASEELPPVYGSDAYAEGYNQITDLPAINIPRVRSGAPVTFVIITNASDAERYLPACIDSLPEWAEIVVCHTEPSDCESLTVVDEADRITTLRYTYTGRFDFGRARNAAKQAARSEWVFHIDTDERLIPTQHAKLRKLTEIFPADVGGVYVTMVGHHDGATLAEKRYAFPIMRMHRNVPEVNWIYSIHEQLSPSVAFEGYKDADTDLVVIHEGYRADKAEMLDKFDRNLKAMIYQYVQTPNQFFYTKIMQTVLTAYRLKYM